ncbi:lycopene cyclase domain-containing protein [Pseudolysinimonas kribbensis]|uniref:lycopene cyclase domain-containing protein n=1 Tax=Pseudolysinimonas kribbensis TaxID=433641 RepID=UPI0031DE647C
MTYLLLNLPFLCAVALVALAAGLARRAPRWRAVGLAAIPLVLLTAVFDNVIVGTGIVAYDADRISGIRLGVMPIEDFAYALAAVVLLPSLWSLLAPRRRPAP